MNQVNDLAHFSTLTKGLKLQFQQIETNCYLLPDLIKHYTQQKRLFWQAYPPAGLIFFSDERDFLRMYYFIGKPIEQQPPEPFPRQSKVIMLDLVSRALDESSSSLAFWVRQGFKLHLIHRRMELTRPFAPIPESPRFAPYQAEYKIAQLASSSLEEIRALWQDNLDLLSTPLPDQAETLEMIARNQLTGIFHVEKQQLAGVLRTIPNGNSCTMEHLVVSPEHRNRGLAQTLFRHCLELATDANRFLLWVTEDNLAAVELHKKLGYHFDSRVSTQLFLDKK